MNTLFIRPIEYKESYDSEKLITKGFHSIIHKDGSLQELKKSHSKYYYEDVENQLLDYLPGKSRHILYVCDTTMTYNQYDSIEVYIKYQILKNPNLKIVSDPKYLKEIGVKESNIFSFKKNIKDIYNES